MYIPVRDQNPLEFTFQNLPSSRNIIIIIKHSSDEVKILMIIGFKSVIEVVKLHI